jgi:hypothetical protein
VLAAAVLIGRRTVAGSRRLRQIKQSPVRGWYEQKKRKDQDRGLGAVVAVMRKLALALYAVGARSVPFDSQRLFPGRPWPRCEMTSVPTPQGALPPTPRDLSPSGQSRKARKKKGAAER